MQFLWVFHWRPLLGRSFLASALEAQSAPLFFLISTLKNNRFTYTCNTYTHVFSIIVIHECIYYMSWIKIILCIILSNIISPNNLLLNLHLFILNMHVNFHANRMLFTIWFINSSLMHYFKLQILEFKQLINDMIIYIPCIGRWGHYQVSPGLI